MSFSRDEVAAYEKGAAPAAAAPAAPAAAAPAAPAAAAPAAAATPTESNAPPADAPAAAPAESQPEAAPASGEAVPAVPGGESSAENSAESAAAPAKSDSETPPEGANAAPKGSASERIADLVAERNAFRKYGEYQGEQIARLTAEIDTLKKGKAPGAAESAATAPAAPAAQPAAAPVNDPRPTLEQFDFDPVQFEAADAAWIQRQIDRKVEERLGKKDAETQKHQAEAAAKAVVDAFNGRMTEFAKGHPDLKVVLANPALPALSPIASRQIMVSDLGPAVLYHLGKNPDLTTRIARMSPEQQLVALGRIEVQVTPQAAKTAPTPPKQKTTTQAPPPPTPVSGAAAAQKSISDMTMEEFVAHERSEALRKREQRAAVRKAMR